MKVTYVPVFTTMFEVTCVTVFAAMLEVTYVPVFTTMPEVTYVPVSAATQCVDDHSCIVFVASALLW